MSKVQNILNRRLFSGGILAFSHIWVIFILSIIVIGVICRKFLSDVLSSTISIGYIAAIIALITGLGIINITNNINHASGITLPKSWLNNLYMQPFGINIILVGINFWLFAKLLLSSYTETRLENSSQCVVQFVVLLNTLYDIIAIMDSTYSISLIPKYFTIEMFQIYRKSLTAGFQLSINQVFRLVIARLLIDSLKYAGKQLKYDQVVGYMSKWHLSAHIILETFFINFIFALSVYLTMQIVHYFLYYPLDFSKLTPNKSTETDITTGKVEEEALLEQLHTFYATMKLTPKDSTIYQNHSQDILQKASQSELFAYFRQLYSLQYQYFLQNIDAKELTTFHIIPYFYEQDYWMQLGHSFAWFDFARIAKLHSSRRQSLYSVHWLTIVDGWMKLIQSFVMQIQYVNDYLFEKPKTAPVLKVLQPPLPSTAAVVSKLGKVLPPPQNTNTAATAVPLSVDQLSSLRRRFDPQVRVQQQQHHSYTTTMTIDPVSPVPNPVTTENTRPVAQSWFDKYVASKVQAWKTYSLEVFLTEIGNYFMGIPIRGELNTMKLTLFTAPAEVTPQILTTRISEVTLQFLRHFVQPMLCQLMVNSIDSMGWLLHFALREDKYGHTMKTVVAIFFTLIQLDVQLQRYMAILQFADGTRILPHRRRFLRLRLLRRSAYMPKELLLLKRVLKETILRILHDYQDVIMMNLKSFPELELQRVRYYQKKL